MRQRNQRRRREAERAAESGEIAGSADVNRRYAQAVSGAQAAAAANPDDAAADSGGDAAADSGGDAEAAARAQQDEETEDLFSAYTPRHITEGQPHPDTIVETTSLSFAALPKPAIRLDLPDGIKKPRTDDNPHGGALSIVQLEAISYACQQHEKKLAAGERAGFFLGDGVGLGKGRTLAGIVVHNWRRGRRRHLWLSVSADLVVDARRDLDDIGAQEIDVVNVTRYGVQGRVTLPEGVLFSTYAALVSRSSDEDARARRIDQIKRWIAGDGSGGAGCIFFDESHKAKHLMEVKTRRNGQLAKDHSTKTAKAVKELQEMLPDARVVYCSATGCSSLENMA
jgi:hypothetical protein